MSRGYYVPCAPFLYLVPDSGGAPGMDCLPLQQRSPGPFHYLIHEQAKSLVALQELQNEVGALLEFRDLVMETFPHLQQKMGSSSCIRSTVSNITNPSNIPVPLTCASRRGEWEPGRVKRKPHHKEAEVAASARPKTLTQQPKSGEASGTSSAGSSAVQDSGFSSSSKEQGKSAPSELDEAEDELWNLLDVIHRKGTRLREEVEHLQHRLQKNDRQVLGEELGILGEGGPHRRKSDDLRILETATFDDLQERDRLHGAEKSFQNADDNLRKSEMNKDELRPTVDGEDEVVGLRRERDYLLDKVAEMEAETLASRLRTSQLQTELGSLVAAKRDLEEQLRAAVNQKSELNSRIHDLHLQFVSGKHSSTSSSYSPLGSELASRKLVVVTGARKASLGSSSHARGAGGFTPVVPAVPSRRASDGFPAKNPPEETEVTDPGGRILGTLDGIISSPTRLPKAAPDPRKVAAILQEFNPVELQRHLLTTSVQNKVLHKHLEKISKSQVDLAEQLDKVKDENDDLRFQLEEKSIELEGTRARVRVLERLQQKTCPPRDISEPSILPPDTLPHPILPLLALPMPVEDNFHHSSSTESAHDHAEISADQGEEKKLPLAPASPKKRPSKIPLPGMKSYCAPKPPSGKSTTGKSKDSPLGKSKTDTSLSGKSTRETSWKNRSDSASSLSGGKSRDSSTGGRNSSLSGRQNSRESLSGNKSRDSLSSKSRSDSLSGKKCNGDSMSSGKTRDSQNSFSSNASAANKKDSLPNKGKDTSFSSPSSRKGLHHQLSTRRVSNASISRGNLIEQGDQNSKVLTASDSLEPKLSSSLASNTNADLTDGILDQHGDTFSDSLNQLPDPTPFKSSTDTIAFNTLEQHSVSNDDCNHAFPWHSSSSEYFDSINNSGSIFNNASLLRSCSYFQEQYLQSSSQGEGLAECDSLETKQTEDIVDVINEVENLSLSANSTMNIWVKPEKHSGAW